MINDYDRTFWESHPNTFIHMIMTDEHFHKGKFIDNFSRIAAWMGSNAVL
jgi:hypothetical protein